MAINNGMFTSLRQNWKTPVKIYEQLNKEFDFDHDPCIKDDGADFETNAFYSDWGKRNYVNPPYNNLYKWCLKAYQECEKGNLVVMLIPSRTDTKWWHEFIMKATEIRFIQGRLCFDDSGNPAPFPSCIVIFKPGEVEVPIPEGTLFG
jgi:phage N-6-adenine-methyltransferase